jgi:hypothetical protein
MFSAIPKNLALVIVIGLLALIASCSFPNHITGYNQACYLNVPMFTGSSDKGNLVLGFVLIALLFFILGSRSTPTKIARQSHVSPNELWSFFNPFYPTSAYTLVRTTQRKVL